MGVTSVVGANWGDEGKGKMVDYLAERSDVVVRFQGGSNAGHTVINRFGKFALHLLPSGIFYPDVVNILGPGVALDVSELSQEIAGLEKRGVPKPKVMVSERAQVMMPYHKLFDGYEEERLGARQFGSTRSGIAPFYSDKYAKIGFQIGELYDIEALTDRLVPIVQAKNVILEHLYHKPALDAKEIARTLNDDATKVRNLVKDTSTFLHKAIREGKSILLEGQLGALRDPDHGIYPFSTSSSTLAGFASVGAGIPPYAISDVIAVVKAYSSAVGAGPFVTELQGEAAHELRERGGDAGEYGAKTGRPRRVGWFDAVATRYGCRMQGATTVALTLLDVLGYLDSIPVCVEYEIDGERTAEFPLTGACGRARPVYRELEGWKQPISHIRDYDDLPRQAKSYVSFVEDEIGVKIGWISVGPRREQTIMR